MTTDDHRDLEPIDPRTAQQLYLDHKATQCSEVTVHSHKYRTNYFVQWCSENSIDNLNNLSGRDIHEFRLWRESEGGLNKVSLRTQMSTLRVFLKWCGSIEAVGPDLYNKVLVLQVSSGKEQRNVLLESERAEEILQHLSKYSSASQEYVLLALLWETGMRIGTARSLYLCDVYLEEQYLEVVHRPETGTTLKNAEGGERLVTISDTFTELLQDYLEDTRIEITDDNDRNPLLTGYRGRLSRSTIRRIVYELTAPCYLDQECPDCNANSDEKYLEAVNPHAVRRGSITHFLTCDVPIEIVGDRMDVSRSVLDKHYDQRTEEVKLEQRRGYLDNI